MPSTVLGRPAAAAGGDRACPAGLPDGRPSSRSSYQSPSSHQVTLRRGMDRLQVSHIGRLDRASYHRLLLNASGCTVDSGQVAVAGYTRLICNAYKSPRLSPARARGWPDDQFRPGEQMYACRPSATIMSVGRRFGWPCSGPSAALTVGGWWSGCRSWCATGWHAGCVRLLRVVGGRGVGDLAVGRWGCQAATRTASAPGGRVRPRMSVWRKE